MLSFLPTTPPDHHCVHTCWAPGAARAAASASGLPSLIAQSMADSVLEGRWTQGGTAACPNPNKSASSVVPWADLHPAQLPHQQQCVHHLRSATCINLIVCASTSAVNSAVGVGMQLQAMLCSYVFEPNPPPDAARESPEALALDG
eukprot:362783-Chlamydomonas_euryale.AAC.10